MVKKDKKELVENCFALKIADLGRRLFSGSNSVVSGSLLLSVGEQQLTVNYELLGDVLYVEYNGTEQSVTIKTQSAFRGHKTYFVCACGKRRKALYLRSERFQCRVCAGLVYISTRVDRQTANGKIFSDFARLTRIVERREAMQSIFYRGRPTKRYSKLLYDAERLGFNGYAQEQRNGIEEIRMMENAVNMAKGGR